MTPCEIEIYTGYIYTTQATKLGYISIDKKSKFIYIFFDNFRFPNSFADTLPFSTTCGLHPELNGRNSAPFDRIVGGVTARKHHWPFITHLLFSDGDHFRGKCGGTILSDNWILTGAHCCYSKEHRMMNEKVKVRVRTPIL